MKRVSGSSATKPIRNQTVWDKLACRDSNERWGERKSGSIPNTPITHRFLPENIRARPADIEIRSANKQPQTGKSEWVPIIMTIKNAHLTGQCTLKLSFPFRLGQIFKNSLAAAVIASTSSSG